jgi:hypothetical protein
MLLQQFNDLADFTGVCMAILLRVVPQVASDKSQDKRTAGAEGVCLAGQSFCVERDAVLMSGSEFTAGEH